MIQPAVQRVRFRSLCHPGPRLSAPHSFEIVIGTLVDECQYKEYQRFDLPDSAAAYRWLLRHESFVRPETSNAIRRLRMKFRPLHDRVVVKRIDAEDKTSGGIIIPDSAKEKPSMKSLPSARVAVTRQAS